MNEYRWKSKDGRVLLRELEQENEEQNGKSSEIGGSGGGPSPAKRWKYHELWRSGLPAPISEYNNDLFTNPAMARNGMLKLMGASSSERWAVELPYLHHKGVRGDGDAQYGAEDDQKYTREGSLVQSIESTVLLYQDGPGLAPSNRGERDPKRPRRGDQAQSSTNLPGSLTGG